MKRLTFLVIRLQEINGSTVVGNAAFIECKKNKATTIEWRWVQCSSSSSSRIVSRR